MKIKMIGCLPRNRVWPWGLLVLYTKVSEVQVTSKNKVLHALKFTNPHTSF